MTPRTRRPVDASVDAGSGWRAVALVGLTIALLAVVAVASGGVDVPGVGRGPGISSPAAGLSAGSYEYLLLLAIAGFAGVVVLLAFAFQGASWSSRGGVGVARGGARVPRWLGAILLVAVAALPIAIASWVGGAPRGGETVSGVRRSVTGVTVPEPSGPAASSDGWSWTPVIAAVGIAFGATVVAAGLRARERRRGTPATQARRVAAAATLDRTIDDLRGDPDPRHAVISAYAWMEDELTAGGRGRRPSEAPFEYLDDALRELAVPPAPARSLTELFEVARFSRHRVDPSMRDHAIAALVEIRGSLREEPSR